MTIRVTGSQIVVPGLGPSHYAGQNYIPTQYPADTFVNILHNGDFRVNQRAIGSTQGNTMVADRWYNSFVGTGTRTLVINATNQFPGYYLRRTMTSAGTYASSTSYEWICAQGIEGQNLAHIGLGGPGTGGRRNLLNASLWVRASQTGTSGILLGVQNSSGTWFYAYQMFNIIVANKWEYKSVTFDVSSSLNCPDPIFDTGFRMFLYVIGACNTGYQGGTPGVFSSSTFFANSSVTNFCATNGATFDVSRIQLSVGGYSWASEYEQLPFALELQRCQRYYQKSYPYESPPATLSINGAHGVTWVSRQSNQNGGVYYTIYFRGGPMRAAPNVTVYSPISGSSGFIAGDTGPWINYNIGGSTVTANSYRIISYRPGPNYYGIYDALRGAWLHYTANADAI